MQIQLAYGRAGLVVDLPAALDITVIEPRHSAPLPDPARALRAALRRPLNSAPLRAQVSAEDTVAVVFSDITRPTPNHLLLPAVLAELDHVPPENIVLCNALGSHRANTRDELAEMLGAQVVERYRIEQNDAFDPATQVYVGRSARGNDIWINRVYMDASFKILTGFIEPHFFAGFSGGGKAAMPGMAGQATILNNHNAAMVGHPLATWGVAAGNPIWEEAREAALMTRPDFLLNVTLDRAKQITGIFAGELCAAHDAGIDFVRARNMVPVDEPFDIVLTTNSGYPLDMNLYQTVKGMSAAEPIVRAGGAIIMASSCLEGIPEHGLYGALLRGASSPAELYAQVMGLTEPKQDQWMAQIQARIQQKADVYLYTDGLTDQQIRDSLLTRCDDIPALVEALLRRYGPQARIGVLPEGPQTIAFVRAVVA